MSTKDKYALIRLGARLHETITGMYYKFDYGLVSELLKLSKHEKQLRRLCTQYFNGDINGTLYDFKRAKILLKIEYILQRFPSLTIETEPDPRGRVLFIIMNKDKANELDISALLF